MMMNGFVWLGRLGTQRICHLCYFFGHDKIFLCCAGQSLFNKQNIHTRSHTHTHTLYNAVCLGANDCVGHGPVANTQQPLGGRRPRWPHGIIIRQNNLHCELEQFFSPSLSLFSSRFYFVFSFIFVLFFFFLLARKMKMFNGKNKILTFLSQANVIQFVLLVRKLK